MKDLTPKVKYFYRCGSDLGWSAKFWFNVPPLDSDWSPHLAIYGDMGTGNVHSLPPLQTEVQQQLYDALIHNGDFAYDMHSQNAAVGDTFMREIESIAAYIPYMVSVGNHEIA